jgi:mono/diheme cytochrome c family protein
VRNCSGAGLIWVIAPAAAPIDHGRMKNLPQSSHRHSVWTTLATGVLAAAVWCTAASADDVGDPVNGRRIAAAWCANCHAVPGSKIVTATGAPTFPAIAADRAVTPLSLRAFLQTPHERMPDLHLSNGETDDLIAFILASRTR